MSVSEILFWGGVLFEKIKYIRLSKRQQYLEIRIVTVIIPSGWGIPVKAVPSVITCRGLLLR
jgi:hypothetical protein